MVAVMSYFIVSPTQINNSYEEEEWAGRMIVDVIHVGPGSELYASKQTCIASLRR